MAEQTRTKAMRETPNDVAMYVDMMKLLFKLRAVKYETYHNTSTLMNEVFISDYYAQWGNSI